MTSTWTTALVLIASLFSRTSFATQLTLAQFTAQMQQQVATLASTTTAGIYMEVEGSGQLIFAHNGETPLVPASASKLMTTSAALEQLGPAFTYETKVVQQGEDLIIVGNGDPYMVTERITALAQSAAKIVRHVTSIKIDNSAYTQDYNGLAQFAGFDGETDASIVSPTSLNYNLLTVTVTPGRHGIATLTAGPSHNAYAIFKNTVRQVPGSANSLAIKSLGMTGNREIFSVSGTIGASSPAVQIQIAVTSPEAHYAYAFAGLLRDQGVIVDEDYGGSSFQPIDPGGPIAASMTSLPLNQLADLYMTYSNNFMAEQTFQTFGAAVVGGPANITKSEQAMAAFLHQRPICQTSSMENGSGLTWNNLISPHCFVATIQSLMNSPTVYTDLIDSLPTGGQAGTLAGRFGGAPAGFKAALVHAKTGTLWSKVATSALIGVTRASSGQTVLFALIENDQRNLESVTNTLKNWEDGVVELIQQLKF